ncbi:cupredoxin domain-containing protein [Alicyclobacillus fastidiosus]|uniref:cupredoxin domain-containing protein n=1 Tax=Alicyclobacillus fastidiosus TaxID=392011 RepID=UPI0023E95417|nr:cupredoxin domain-containing protein [Alicyclobacillus fastidiosus]GMA62284.1 hypothetical protein GCM10025859_27240 [Alicyclobacillus fastidiosus]
MRVLRLCTTVMVVVFLPFSATFAQTVQVTLHDGSIEPAVIQSTKGQEVRVFIQNRGTTVHNFVVPNFYVFTQNLQPGGQVNVKFTPDKTGTFPFYSDKKGFLNQGCEEACT